jgi:hypothetical protein
MLGVIAGLEIYQYVFDLSAHDLEAEEQLFAEEVTKLVTPNAVLPKASSSAPDQQSA